MRFLNRIHGLRIPASKRRRPQIAQISRRAWRTTRIPIASVQSVESADPMGTGRSGFQRSSAYRARGLFGARRRSAPRDPRDGRPAAGNRQRGTGRGVVRAWVWQMMADFRSD